MIIFDESGDAAKDTQGEFTGVKKKGNPNQTLARILREFCFRFLFLSIRKHRVLGVSTVPSQGNVPPAQGSQVCRPVEPAGHAPSLAVSWPVEVRFFTSTFVGRRN